MKAEYKENYNELYDLIIEVDNKKYYVYTGLQKELLKFSTDRYDAASITSKIIESLNIHKYDKVSRKKFENINYYMKKRGSKELKPLVYYNKRDNLYVTSNDILRIMINNNLIKDSDFMNEVCLLFDKDYEEKGKKNFDHKAKRASNIDMVKRIIVRHEDYKPGMHTFKEDIARYDDALYYVLYTICRSYNKKEKLINLLKEKINTNSLLKDNVYSERQTKLGYYLMKKDENNILSNKKHFIEYIIAKRISSVLDYHYKEKGKETKTKFDSKLDEYKLKAALIKHENNDYYEYLIQEGIPVNDAGEPLFDQEYDLDNKKK